MSINEAIMRYNLLTPLKYKDGDYSLSRDLKIRLIKLKIELDKVFNDFNAYQEKCIEAVKTDEYNKLIEIPENDRTKEQNEKLDEIVRNLNDEMNELLSKKSQEMIQVNAFDYLSEDEFEQVLEVNVDNEVTINGNTIDGATYISLLHQGFTKPVEE